MVVGFCLSILDPYIKVQQNFKLITLLFVYSCCMRIVINFMYFCILLTCRICLVF